LSAAPNAKLVSLAIDGQLVTVPDGTLVADAAKMAGVDIPVFCHHPKLEPVGMCRMCLVEIGRPVRDRATGQVVLENGQPKIQFMPKLETALNPWKMAWSCWRSPEGAGWAGHSRFCSSHPWTARSATRANARFRT
jgi:hypothetical protein